MGLQKFRADEQGQPAPNGSIAWFTRWMGGPSLAKVQNCPVVVCESAKIKIAPRTVYVRDEYGSAATEVKIGGKRVTLRGQLYLLDDGGGHEFRPSYESILRAGGTLHFPIRQTDRHKLVLRIKQWEATLDLVPLVHDCEHDTYVSRVTGLHSLDRGVELYRAYHPDSTYAAFDTARFWGEWLEQNSDRLVAAAESEGV